VKDRSSSVILLTYQNKGNDLKCSERTLLREILSRELAANPPQELQSECGGRLHHEMLLFRSSLQNIRVAENLMPRHKSLTGRFK